MKFLTAEEAAAMTVANVPDDYEAWAKCVDNQIRAATGKGERRIVNPFQGYRMLGPSMSTANRIRDELQKAGYRWTNHPDPDPGHPCSRPYVEISW